MKGGPRRNQEDRNGNALKLASGDILDGLSWALEVETSSTITHTV